MLQEVLSISLLSEGVAENIGTLFKCLGVCYVVQLAADSCRDAGQQAIASKAVSYTHLDVYKRQP